MEPRRPPPDNMVAALEDVNLYASDPALRRRVAAVAPDADAELAAQGAVLGSARTLQLADDANRHPPEQRTHARTGERIDRVDFHPAWHELMGLARRHGLANRPYADPRPSAWTVYAASLYLHSQVEAGTMCPTSMTQASIGVLAREPALFDTLRPRLLSTEHDPRDLPLEAKAAVAIGMGMTERQGGSDVRSNRTRAQPAGGGGGSWRLRGHKWFFSAPMCDAHLVLAQTDAGPTCFFVPRWRPDGARNAVHIQRLKDKVGNRSNASAEVEFDDAWGLRVGAAGRGIPTILERASGSRLNCALASAGFLRQAFAQALHYARHRVAFGRTLIEQPLMARLLADLGLEAEAAMRLVLTLAGCFGPSADPLAPAMRRILVPVAKFWICKRAVEATAEAMEVFGGNGYVEEAPMGRLFREAPVNSIWEGSGNVICLDLLRAIARTPDDALRLLDRYAAIARAEPRLAEAVEALRTAVRRPPEEQEPEARRIAVGWAKLAQACTMLEQAEPAAAEAFVASRFDPGWGAVLGISCGTAEARRLLDGMWRD
jgi:putative acyl-CoA dehydrogenase